MRGVILHFSICLLHNLHNGMLRRADHQRWMGSPGYIAARGHRATDEYGGPPTGRDQQRNGRRDGCDLIQVMTQIILRQPLVISLERVWEP